MNYTEAARLYHTCANKDSDLIDWVDKNVVNKEKQK